MSAKRLPWDYTGSAARTPECDADLTTEMARCQSPQGASDEPLARRPKSRLKEPL